MVVGPLAASCSPKGIGLRNLSPVCPLYQRRPQRSPATHFPIPPMERRTAGAVVPFKEGRPVPWC